MKPILLRVAGFALLVLVLQVLWNEYKRVLFPTDVNFYVLDSRTDSNFAEDLQKLLPTVEQRFAGFRINVKPIVRNDVSSTELQWRRTLDMVANSPGSETVFFELGWPTTKSKKLLRSEIEKRFIGAERVAFLGRVIAFVGVHSESVSQACDQLADDFTYLDWNFGGIALIVDDDTLPLIESCLPHLLTEHFRDAD